MLKTLGHWFFHSWSNWSEPIRLGISGGFIRVQRRTCGVCNMVEERIV